MLKRALLLLSLVLASAVLAGCGLLGGAGTEIAVSLQPTQLGFEVNDSGEVTIVANNVIFTNPANASSARVTGYSIRFFDDADAEIVVDSDLTNVRGLAIEIPAGYSCPNAESQVCAITERTPEPTQSQPQPFIFVPGSVAWAILDLDEPDPLLRSPLTRVHAEITFMAVRDGEQIEWPVLVDVTYPVAGE